MRSRCSWLPILNFATGRIPHKEFRTAAASIIRTVSLVKLRSEFVSIRSLTNESPSNYIGQPSNVIEPASIEKRMPRYANSRLKAAVHQIRREEIETAALKIVCKRGFPATSLRLVAREAKVPLSILHYYFKDKNELMHCAVQRLFDGMLRALTKIRTAEPDPVKRIDRLLETYLIRTTEEWQASLAFIEYWAACVRAGTVDKFYTQVQFRYSEPMAEALREAGAEEPEELARALLALMTGYDTFYWSKPADKDERTRFLDFAHAMVRHAVARGRAKLKLVRKAKPEGRGKQAVRDDSRSGTGRALSQE